MGESPNPQLLNILWSKEVLLGGDYPIPPPKSSWGEIFTLVSPPVDQSWRTNIEN